MRLPKGLLLCLMSVAAIATSSVLTKEVMQTVPFIMAGLLWFSGAFVWFCILGVIRQQNPFRCITEHWKVGVIVGGLNYLSSLTLFFAISTIGPSTTGFLVRFEVIVLLLLGVLLLHEKLSRWDLLGMAVAFSGALLLTFSIEHVLWFGIFCAILSSCVNAVHNYFSKRFISGINPSALCTVRAFYTSLFFIPTAFLFGSFTLPSLTAVSWLTLGT